MADEATLPDDRASRATTEERLESWKEIAAYLRRDVRTVQRWEKGEGLPVHRHQHEKLGSVYGYKSELDAWRRNGHERLEDEAATIGTPTIPYASVKNRKLVWSGAIFAVLTVAVAGYWFLGRNRDSPFQHFMITKMTDTGSAGLVAVSPEGKYIVHVVVENGMSSIWMRHIATNSKTQIIPPSSTDYSGLSFSPDGNYIFFVRSDSDNPSMYDLFQVPALGGNPKQLARDVASDVTFSPDGQRMAFCRYLPSTNETALITASVQGGEEKKLMTVQRPVAIELSPAWSPDGKTIVLNIQDPKSEFNGPLMAVDSSTGQQQLLLNADRIFQNPKWLPAGTGLLVLESDKTMGGRHQIGIVSYPEGRFRRITNDVNGYRSFSVSKDGNLVATVLSQIRSTIRVSSAVEGTGIPESQFVSPMNSPWWNFTWTKNGALLIQQYPKLLMLSPGSAAPVDFKDIALGPPNACADGKHIVYLGTVGISRMDASGNNVTQITWGNDDFGPVCSHDGKWVYYVDTTKGSQKIMKVGLEGGTPPQQFSKLIPTDIWLDLSRDGKWLAVDVSTANSHKLAIISADSGDTSQILEPDKGYTGQPRFTPDCRSIAYQVREDRGVAIWAQPLDGSPGRLITSAEPDEIGNFHWSLDGRMLAVSRIHRVRDIALIVNVQ